MAESARLVCPGCQSACRVRPGTPPGTRVKCPRCGGPIVVGEPEGGPVSEPALAGVGYAEFAGSPDDRQVTLVAAGSRTPTLPQPESPLGASVDQALAACGPAAGRYVEQGIIGRGGMGEIALCVDRNIRRQVAMKRMLPAIAGDPSRRARFVEEAQVTGQLEHPNIVPVHELERADDGAIYFTMKLVKGRSLADILTAAKEGSEALNLGELLQVFLKICDGVAFAHSRGVIHRDLKPANVMVGDYGEVLVMDWGLAKIVGREDIRAGELVESSRVEMADLKTLEGSALGTPAYMSPEQAEGKIDQLDQRSDIYSLGAILYEMLTVERAIQGENQMAVILNVVTGNIVPPEKRAPGRHIPRELSAITMKCLSKLRKRRYQSVRELRRDIGLFLEGRSVSAAPDSFGQAVVKLVKRNKGVSVAAGAAAVLLLALTTLFIVRLKGERDRSVANEQRAVRGEQAALAAQKEQWDSALVVSERFARQAVRAADDGRWEEAEQRATDAEAICRNGPWALYARGRFAQMRSQHEKAIEFLQNALALANGHADIQAALNRSTEFFTDLELARRLARGSAPYVSWQTFEATGEKMMAAERWADAAALFTGALRTLEQGSTAPLDPKNPVVDTLRHRLGEAKAWIACDGFAEALRKLPAEEQVRRTEAKLSEVSGQPIRLSEVQIKDGKWIGARLDTQPVRYLEPLRAAPLTSLDLNQCDGVRDLTPLKGMPLTRLNVSGEGIRDWGPLRGLPLQELGVGGNNTSGDLSPLKGMPLTRLGIHYSPVRDLRPLEGMRLTHLHLEGTPVTDLSPIRGMPLTELRCVGTGISDLSVLRGMPLTGLHLLYNGNVSDLGPLKGLPLATLSLSKCPKVTDLSPLEGMPLRELYCHENGVADLSPLRGMNIGRMTFSPARIRKGIEALRGMKSLSWIGVSGEALMPAEEFWKKYDAGEFK